jgi:predicted metal-binding membrane protein
MCAARSLDAAPGASIAIRRDSTAVVTVGGLLAVTVVAWAHVLWSALAPHDMASMALPAGPGLADGARYVAAWTVMMAAMMLPSALPMIALHAATLRAAPPRARARGVTEFALVYVALWAATGVPMYLATVALTDLPSAVVAHGVAGVLVAAGLFQLSPLKRVCLRACRSPVGFLLGHWRPGRWGSLALGWAHAVYCLGCCWALMVVLVAAGAMGLAWVLLIAAVVAAEKLAPGGEWIARLTGAALVLAGVTVAAFPALAGVLRAGGHAM